MKTAYSIFAVALSMFLFFSGAQGETGYGLSNIFTLDTREVLNQISILRIKSLEDYGTLLESIVTDELNVDVLILNNSNQTINNVKFIAYVDDPSDTISLDNNGVISSIPPGYNGIHLGEIVFGSIFENRSLTIKITEINGVLADIWHSTLFSIYYTENSNKNNRPYNVSLRRNFWIMSGKGGSISYSCFW